MGGVTSRPAMRLAMFFCFLGLLAGCGGDSPSGPGRGDGIAAIAISPGSLAYTPGTTACDVQVDNAVATMTFTVTLAARGDSLTIAGVPAAAGVATEVALAVGDNPIAIVARSAHGDTTGACTVNVLRLAEPGHATLSYLVLSAGNLAPIFTPSITGYTAELNHATSELVILPVAAADELATITVNGAVVASAQDSPPIPVVDGPNTVTIVVTAEDGVTTETYTIVATRLAAGVVSSSPEAVGIACYVRYPRRDFTLVPAFDPAVTSYTVNRVSTGGSNDFSLEIAARNDAASIRTYYPIGGYTNSGSWVLTGMGNIDVGSSYTFRFRITAPDGVATREYSVTINIVAPG